MKKKNTLFQHLKQWCLKVSVSSIIFISIVLLGGAIITLALPSSLDEVKSTNAHQQLTAENWDYLVDQVKSGTVNLTNLSGKISTNITNITNLSGRIAINATNIANLSGRLTTVSSTINSGRKKMGDTIYYTSGNVGIGITAPSDKLHVNGNIIANGGIKVGTSTATCSTSIAGTLKYTGDCLSYCNGSEWKNVLCEEVISNPLCGNAGIEYVDADIIVRNGRCGGYIIANKNLGASVAGITSASYGNLFQWGNNYGFPNDDTATIGTTQIDASSYGPSTYSSNIFRRVAGDWSSVQNDNLRGHVTNTQIAKKGPCPVGYHIPSIEEWQGIIQIGVDQGWRGNSQGYNLTQLIQKLQLPLAGCYDCINPRVDYLGSRGEYWTSTPSSTSAFYIWLLSGYGEVSPYSVRTSGTMTRSKGASIRCFKN